MTWWPWRRRPAPATTDAQRLAEICAGHDFLRRRATEEQLEAELDAALALVRAGGTERGLAQLQLLLRTLGIALEPTGLRGSGGGAQRPNRSGGYPQIEAYTCPRNTCDRFETRPSGTAPIPRCGIHEGRPLLRAGQR